MFFQCANKSGALYYNSWYNAAMNKIEAVIFDVDGVLVESKEANIFMFQAVLAKAGYPTPTRKEILDCFHLPLRQSLERLTGSSDPEEIQRIWDSAHDPSVRPPHLYQFPDEIDDVLRRLNKSYRLGIVTSRSRGGMESVFMAHPIQHFFDVVVVFEDYNNPKPHPEPLLLAAKQLRVHPEAIAYVGDSTSDVEAAKAAGMKSIHLSPSKHQDADAGINSVVEIIEVLHELDGERA